MSGMLYLCATPIGNLEDITLRAVRILGMCDAVYAEDTRRTLQLLNHLGLKKPLVSCHKHNERQRAGEMVARAAAGDTLCLVSDAGMPGISDPGAALVAAAIEADVPFTVLPGASAALMALVLSGLPGERFAFEGFLPGERALKERLITLAQEERTMVIYEAPHRLERTLRALLDALGDRNAAVLRELTKIHEQALRLPLSALLDHFARQAPRGECVIVVDGKPRVKEEADPAQWLETLREYMSGGMRVSEAARAAAGEHGVPYRSVYRLALEHKEELSKK